MESELRRVASYEKWQGDSSVSLVSLARNGFYHLGPGDDIECAHCKTRVIGWNGMYNPLEKHKQVAPGCSSHVNGVVSANATDGGGRLAIAKTTGASRLADTDTDNPRALHNGYLQLQKDDGMASGSLLGILNAAKARADKWEMLHRNSHSHVQQQSSPDFERLNLETRTQVNHYPPMRSFRSVQNSALLIERQQTPKFPEYMDVGRRLSSFTYGTLGRGQTAERLADAGFFYVGPDDKVQCFQCGGNLKDWEHGDDPFDEHRRWYEHCPYAQAHQPSVRTRGSETSLFTIPVGNVSYRIEPREVEARMNTPTVRAIIEMGYTRDLIKAAIETKLSRTGDDFLSAEHLLEAIFQLQEKMATSSVSAAPACGSTLRVTDRSSYETFGSTTSWSANPTDGSESYYSEEEHEDRRAGVRQFSSSREPPKYPEFENFSRRVDSFRRGILGAGQSAERLADAGFFYVGPNDKVQCFQCGGNLRGREVGDDPWMEHRRWYGHCPYIQTHQPRLHVSTRATEASLPRLPMRTEQREGNGNNFQNKKSKDSVSVSSAPTPGSTVRVTDSSPYESLDRATTPSTNVLDGNCCDKLSIECIDNSVGRSGGRHFSSGSRHTSEVLFNRDEPDFYVLDTEGFPLRLLTFNDWNDQHGDRIRLAEQGLFYSGQLDIVVCSFCGIRFSVELLVWREWLCVIECPYSHNLDAHSILLIAEFVSEYWESQSDISF